LIQAAFLFSLLLFDKTIAVAGDFSKRWANARLRLGSSSTKRRSTCTLLQVVWLGRRKGAIRQLQVRAPAGPPTRPSRPMPPATVAAAASNSSPNSVNKTTTCSRPGECTQKLIYAAGVGEAWPPLHLPAGPGHAEHERCRTPCMYSSASP
jgi:hypothetical protein